MPFEAIGAPIRAKGGQKMHIAAQFTVICAPIEGIGGPMSVVGAPEIAGGGQLELSGMAKFQLCQQRTGKLIYNFK